MPTEQSKIATFLQKAIIKTLRNNKDELDFLLSGCNRWEKWFQVEFATELIKNEACDVCLESIRSLDGRMQKINHAHKHNFVTAQIDLTFRMKNATTSKKIGVELKQGNSNKDIQRVYKDIFKVRAIRDREWNFRSINFVFFYHENVNSSKYSRLMKDLDERLKAEGYEPCIDINFKDHLSLEVAHGWHCFILCWDAGYLQKNMSSKQFHKWFEVIQSVFNENGVRNIAKGKTKKKLVPSPTHAMQHN